MPSKTSPIEHVVVLMMENRSFDHMLGTMPGINGILGADGKPDPKYFNIDPKSKKKYPAGAAAAFAIPAQDIRGSNGGPGHSFVDATVQMDSSAAVEADVKEPAPLDGFVANYRKELAGVGRSNPTSQEIQEPMTTFSFEQAPVIHQLASNFAVCDNWYSEVPGPTQPNRLFMHAATSTGLVHNLWDIQLNSTTIYDELDKAGQDWAFFFFDLNDSGNYPALKKRIDRNLQFDAFYQQAQAGTLPTYSFLCPRYNDKGTDKPSSQHAPYDIRYGEILMADVYEALRNGPLWDKTLFIINYDEHGGYYDHVSPPSTVNPDGLTSPTDYDKKQAAADPKKNGYFVQPKNDFGFTRLGMRIPAVLVSPWIAKGTIDHTQYQHTSVFATLRDLFGVGSLTKRDAAANSFAPLLTKLATARTDAPPKLVRPALPDSDPTDASKPVTDRQKDIWPILSTFDGHDDSGTVTKPPATREKASRYIEERIAAHYAYHRERRRKAYYHITRDSDGYHWHFFDDRGREVAHSAKAYRNRSAAEADIAKMRDLAPYARQTSEG